MSSRLRIPRTTPTIGRFAVIGAVLVAMTASPFAMAAGEGGTLKGGNRNPSSDASQAYSAETEIIANNATYGTRQSNKGAGGGAIYGCRSAVTANACIRGSNIEKGKAFSFSTGGQLGGEITASGGDSAKPFTTNATGVATGLNADRVDSLDASQIVAQGAAQGADAGAKSAVATIQSGLNFAAVSSTGTLGSSRGVDSASRASAGRYTVTFKGDVSSCVFQATETTVDDAGAAAVSLNDDKKSVTVVTRAGGDSTTTGTAPADKPFHLQATCV